MLLSATALFGQSSKPRTNASLMSFKVKDKQLQLDKRIFTQPGLKWIKEVSLNNCSNELNTIEQGLVAQYADVVVNKLWLTYFLFNEDGYIGVASIDGEILVPPAGYKVRVFPWAVGMCCLFGEESTDFDAFDEKFYSARENKKSGLSLGLSKAVVRIAMGKVELVIPYGKYDYISVVPSGRLNIKGFYVGKNDAENGLLWGVCDSEGNEIIACKYKSVFYNGYSFKGDDSHDMEYWNDYYAYNIQIKKEIQKQRMAEWGAVLNTLGNSLVEAGMAMNGNSSASASSVSAEPDQNSGRAAKKSSHAKSSGSDAVLKNQDARTYSSWETQLIRMSTNTDPYNDSRRKYIQSQMRNIRVKWENKGYSMYKSTWETWGGN